MCEPDGSILCRFVARFHSAFPVPNLGLNPNKRIGWKHFDERHMDVTERTHMMAWQMVGTMTTTTMITDDDNNDGDSRYKVNNTLRDGIDD